MRQSINNIVIVIVAVLCATAMAAPPMPSMKLNPETITVSGISAGAAMAVQVEYAFSKTIKAAGIVAGLPYKCSGGSMSGAFMCMDAPETVNVGDLTAKAKVTADLKEIDDWENIRNHTVTLFSGTKDTIVAPGSMKALDGVYGALGQPENRRLAYFNYSAEHAWITNFYGNPCWWNGSPYVNNCGLDFAGVTLRRGAEGMNLKWNTTRGSFIPSNMHQFDQTVLGASSLVSLDSIGYVYIPRQCVSGSVMCNLHINFHGCEQNRQTLGEKYVDNTGLNQWAETNDIVVVYPQTVNSMLIPENPKGCFDWWGYAGSTYAVKAGPQMKFVANIISTLTGAQP